MENRLWLRLRECSVAQELLPPDKSQRFVFDVGFKKRRKNVRNGRGPTVGGVTW